MSGGTGPLRVLVTGGAGFIGTHLVRRLIREGCAVTVLDNFHQQVHATRTLASDVAPHVRLIIADVSDRQAMAQALRDQHVVVHLAAETGTGQSMYAVRQYEWVNGLGTATLLDLLVNEPRPTVNKLVIASSRAVYGEGKYHCGRHGAVFPGERSVERLARGQFDPPCPSCGADCSVMPTDEQAPAHPSSFYGLTKYMQERTALLFAGALGISAFALRYQNVYGPGQSLSNPYTGILAIFANLARQGKPINVFEDGLESRDFVFVEDVTEATWRCIDPQRRGVEALNIGSGRATAVLAVARSIVEHFASTSRIEVSGAFRKGDVRHCVADIERARAVLGFEPQWDFRSGLRVFLEWAAAQAANESGYTRSLGELKARGLLHG
jgi:dTDP-L-rhamnose 4-epimerase